MLSHRRLILILPLLLLSQPAHAQNPIITSDEAGVPVTAGKSPSVSQRTTLTFKYTNLYSGNFLLPLPAVTGTFPSGQQALFIVDTGSNRLGISEVLAKKLGLSLTKVTLPTFDVKLSPLPYPLSNASSQGNLTLSGAVDVFPEENIGFIGAEGIFGTSLLASAAAVFDGPKKEATFILGGKLTTKEREQLGFPASAASVVASPLEASLASLVTIPVSLDNNGVFRQVKLVVDTGNNQTSIPREAALALGLKSVSLSTSTGLAGSRQTEIAPVETLMIGSLAIHGVPVAFASKDKAASVTIEPAGDETDELGMDILAGYRVLIDLPANRMYIMPEVPQITILPK